MAAQNENALATTKEQQGKQQQRSSETASPARQLRVPDTALLLNPFDFFWFSPSRIMRRMTRELERTAGDPGFMGGGDAGWLPAVEVSQSDGKLRVQAELPGLSPEDVRVEIGDNEIVIQGERRVEHDENRRGVRRTERRVRRFLPHNSIAGRRAGRSGEGQFSRRSSRGYGSHSAASQRAATRCH